MKPVLVLGAAGFTGRLIVEALEAANTPYVLGGRNGEALAQLSGELASKPDYRILDVTSKPRLQAALADVSVVANSVGPFVKLGLPVIEEAIKAGVHYVDTAAEQSFIRKAFETYNQDALEAGVTVLPGHACDFTFSYCGAALIDEAVGHVERFSSFHWPNDFSPSRGTLKSAVGMVAEPHFTYDQSQWLPQSYSWSPKRHQFPDMDEASYTVPFPGGDVILLPRDFPSLEHCTSHLVLGQKESRGLALANKLSPITSRLMQTPLLDVIEEKIQANHKDPNQHQRQQDNWSFFVRGDGPDGRAWCRIEGRDTYGISGVCVAQAARWLAEGRQKNAGVVTTGKAFSARDFLQALEPHGVRCTLTRPNNR